MLLKVSEFCSLGQEMSAMKNTRTKESLKSSKSREIHRLVTVIRVRHRNRSMSRNPNKNNHHHHHWSPTSAVYNCRITVMQWSSFADVASG